MKLSALLGVLVLLAGATGNAAIPTTQKIKSTVLSHQGGVAGSGFSILGAELIQSSGKERLVLDIGDHEGQRFLGTPGYYFAEYQAELGELRIDFSQMPVSRVQEEQLQQKLKSSRLIKSSQLVLDPIDSTLQLTLRLQPGSKVKFYEVKGKKQTAKIAIDIVKGIK